MDNEALEARVTRLEEELRRARRWLALAGAFAVVAIAGACRSAPESLSFGNVRVDDSGIRIADARGEVTLGRSGLTITRVEAAGDAGGPAAAGGITRVWDGHIGVETKGAGQVILLANDHGPSLMLAGDKSDIGLAVPRGGDPSISAHAAKTTAMLTVMNHADSPTCQEGALCKGNALLYLDDGRGHAESLSTEHPAK